MLKIKDEYKLELQTPKTMKLLGSTKKKQKKTKIDKTRNRKNKPSLEVLYNFKPNKSNKSDAYLVNIEPCNLVFWKLIMLSLMKLS